MSYHSQKQTKHSCFPNVSMEHFYKGAAIRNGVSENKNRYTIDKIYIINIFAIYVMYVYRYG